MPKAVRALLGWLAWESRQTKEIKGMKLMGAILSSSFFLSILSSAP